MNLTLTKKHYNGGNLPAGWTRYRLRADMPATFPNARALQRTSHAHGFAVKVEARFPQVLNLLFEVGTNPRVRELFRLDVEKKVVPGPKMQLQPYRPSLGSLVEVPEGCSTYLLRTTDQDCANFPSDKWLRAKAQETGFWATIHGLRSGDGRLLSIPKKTGRYKLLQFLRMVEERMEKLNEEWALAA